MKLLSLVSFICLVIILYSAEINAQDDENLVSATAVFNSLGITGWVQFTEGKGTTISTNLIGVTQDARWTIHKFPVLTTIDPTLRVSEDYVGPVYDPEHTTLDGCQNIAPSDCPVGELTTRFGRLTRDVAAIRVSHVDETGDITLRGHNSIIGRSVVIIPEFNRRVVAATIREEFSGGSPLSVEIYTATFFSPVGGTIYFRQQGTLPLSISGSLYHVTSMQTTTENNLEIHEFGTLEGYQTGSFCDEGTIGSIYDPTNALSITPMNMSDGDGMENETRCNLNMCAFGNLSQRFEALSIESSPIPYSRPAFLFTDHILNLREIGGRSLAIRARNNSRILACAPIVRAETIRVESSVLTIEQKSSFENSTMNVLADYPSDSPTTAILEAVLMTNSLCPESAPIYNPLGVGFNREALTPDEFPLGNIPRKYNIEFAGPATLNLPELPLYGPNTLVSHTLRLMEPVEGGGYIRTCTTLLPAMNSNDNVLLKATFKASTDPIRGGIYMMQEDLSDGSSFRGSTNIVVDLYYSTSNDQQTVDHHWLISGSRCEDLRNGGAPLDVYDPFLVDTDPVTYSIECNGLNQIRCQSGDLSGKHQPLTLSKLTADRITYSFNDLNLQLSQRYSVEGKSLVILGANGGSNISACTYLEKFYLNQPAYNVHFSTPPTIDFDRVTFLNSVTEVQQLYSTLDASDILMVEQQIGPADESSLNSLCATFTMLVMARNREDATVYAIVTQRSLCERYKNDECFLALYEEVCLAVVTTEGSSSESLEPVDVITILFISIFLAWLPIKINVS